MKIDQRLLLKQKILVQQGRIREENRKPNPCVIVLAALNQRIEELEQELDELPEAISAEIVFRNELATQPQVLVMPTPMQQQQQAGAQLFNTKR